MLEASIVTIIWFIVKVIIALFVVYWVGMFLFGLVKLMIERSKGSIFKMLLKVISLLVLGGILAFYLGEGVNHFFGEGKEPVAGGVAALFLLAIYALAKLVGSLYVSASIFAFILWYGLMHYIVVILFGTSEERKQLFQEEERR